MDLYGGIFTARMDLNTTKDERLCLPWTRGRYFLIGRDCQDWTGYIYFEAQKGRSALCFVLIAAPYGISVFPLHHNPICTNT